MSANRDRLILVTGATGKQGGATLRHLRIKGFPVRALTRDPSSAKARALAAPGVEVVAGDMNDSASLGRAVDGVHGVFAVQTFFEEGADAETEQGKRLIDAARDVSHFVYTSVASADRNTGIPHFDSKWRIEEHLRASGLPSAILRPVFFMENWRDTMKGQIDSGTLYWPLRPATKLQQIAVDDIGAFAAMAFDEGWTGKEMDLAGDELTMQQTVEAFSGALGKPVSYQQIPWDVFEQQVGHDLAMMFRWLEENGYTVDIENLRRQRPEMQRLEEWLKDWPR